MLAGYKTYIVGGLGLLSAVAGYLVGDVPLDQAVQLAVTSLLGMTIRNSIK